MKKVAYTVTFLLIVAAPLLAQMLSETTYFTSFAANFFFRDNFHEVVPGRFYRSAEMSRDDLVRTIREKGIKSVVDLRLQRDELDWSGRTEEAAAASAGARYFRAPLSSARADQKDRIEKLLDVYDTVETPVLVHCSSGTHRAGIASAIWLLEKEGADPTVAQDQISLRYGFIDAERKIKAFVQGEPTLDAVIKSYVTALDAGPLTFRDWIVQQHQLERRNRAQDDAQDAAEEAAEAAALSR